MEQPETRTRAALPFSVTWIAISLLLGTASPAAAYLDPISGSVVLQVLAAALLAGLLSVRRAWAWVGDRVRGLFGLRTKD